jgi:hypothetical protein
LEHLESAVQVKSPSPLPCGDVAKGRKGIATAQLASTDIAADTPTNFMIIQFADSSSSERSM